MNITSEQIEASNDASKNLSNLAIFNIAASSFAFVLIAYGFLDKDRAAYKRGAWYYIQSDDGVLCLALLMMAACEIIEATVFYVHPLGTVLPQYSCETNAALQLVQNLFYPLFYYFNYVFLIKKSFIANRHSRKIQRNTPVFNVAWIISLMSITVILPIDMFLVTYGLLPPVVDGQCMFRATFGTHSVLYCAITLTVVNVSLLYTFVVPLYKNAKTISEIGDGPRDLRAVHLRRTARLNVVLVGIIVLCQSLGFILQSAAIADPVAFVPLTPLWHMLAFSQGLLQIDPIIALICVMCMTDIWMGVHLRRFVFRAREVLGLHTFASRSRSHSRGGARVASSDQENHQHVSAKRALAPRVDAVRDSAAPGGAPTTHFSSAHVVSLSRDLGAALFGGAPAAQPHAAPKEDVSDSTSGGS